MFFFQIFSSSSSFSVFLLVSKRSILGAWKCRLGNVILPFFPFFLVWSFLVLFYLSFLLPWRRCSKFKDDKIGANTVNIFSFNRSVYLSIHPFFLLFIYLSSCLSSYLPIYLQICQLIFLSIRSFCLSFYLSIYENLYTPTHTQITNKFYQHPHTNKNVNTRTRIHNQWMHL